MVIATRSRPTIVLNVPLFDQIMANLGCKTDEQCARELGVHRSTVSRMRANECTPSGEVMFQVAEALGVKVEVLFGRPKKEQS
jgi:transcriptional regulator with XRE-family HTH domain